MIFSVTPQTPELIQKGTRHANSSTINNGQLDKPLVSTIAPATTLMITYLLTENCNSQNMCFNLLKIKYTVNIIGLL